MKIRVQAASCTSVWNRSCCVQDKHCLNDFCPQNPVLLGRVPWSNINPVLLGRVLWSNTNPILLGRIPWSKTNQVLLWGSLGPKYQENHWQCTNFYTENTFCNTSINTFSIPESLSVSVTIQHDNAIIKMVLSYFLYVCFISLLSNESLTQINL